MSFKKAEKFWLYWLLVALVISYYVYCYCRRTPSRYCIRDV